MHYRKVNTWTKITIKWLLTHFIHHPMINDQKWSCQCREPHDSEDIPVNQTSVPARKGKKRYIQKWFREGSTSYAVDKMGSVYAEIVEPLYLEKKKVKWDSQTTEREEKWLEDSHKWLLGRDSRQVIWHLLHLQLVSYSDVDHYLEQHIIWPCNQEHHTFEELCEHVDKWVCKHCSPKRWWPLGKTTPIFIKKSTDSTTMFFREIWQWHTGMWLGTPFAPR